LIDLTGPQLAFFVTVAVCAIGIPIARAIGRRIDRPSRPDQSLSADLTGQLQQLQDSVDAIAVELERLAEVQRFMAKLPPER
jgi:hypothetical protein